VLGVHESDSLLRRRGRGALGVRAWVQGRMGGGRGNKDQSECQRTEIVVVLFFKKKTGGTNTACHERVSEQEEFQR